MVMTSNSVLRQLRIFACKSHQVLGNVHNADQFAWGPVRRACIARKWTRCENGVHFRQWRLRRRQSISVSGPAPIQLFEGRGACSEVAPGSSVHTTGQNAEENGALSNSYEQVSTYNTDDERAVGISSAAQRRLLRQKPQQVPHPRLLKVAIIGAPNAGKSTLANQLLGWRFAAVSKKVHTTRRRTLGVLTEENTQIIFLDTPGIIHPGKRKRHNLEKSLVKDPHSTLLDADVIAVVVDVHNIWDRSRLDREVLKALHLHKQKKSILVLNKVDLLKDKKTLLSTVRVLTEGVVDGRVDSKVIRKSQSIDYDTMITKMDFPFQNETNHQNKFDLGETGHDASTAENKNADQNTCNEEALSADSYSARQSIQSTGEDTVLTNRVDAEENSHDADILSAASTNETQKICIHHSKPGSNTCETSTVSRTLTKDLEDGWRDYERALRKVDTQIQDKSGWNQFEKVYIISALDGDGITDIKRYLVDSAYPAPWVYSKALVTDQDPREMARLCVWEKLMDQLPDEIPYQLNVVVSSWYVDDEDILRIVVDIICQKKRHLYHTLGKKGESVRRVASEARQELMNTFRRELSLKVNVKAPKN